MQNNLSCILKQRSQNIELKIRSIKQNNNTTSIHNTQPLFLESFAENYGVRDRPSASRAFFKNLARE